MRTILLLLAYLPLLCFAQKVTINGYDRYVKQHRIELEPVQLVNSENNKIHFSFSSISSTPYITLSGSGTSATTIDANNQVIFLLANDSTVTINSTSLQSFQSRIQPNTYKHQYFVRPQDLQTLIDIDIIGFRKYSFEEYQDYQISKENAARIKKLSSLFMSELKKANVLKTLKFIKLKDIDKYVGDSVMFCSKVYGSRFYEASENKPTILDIQPDFSEPLVRAVIWEQDRKNFNNVPELLYNNKEVCLCGLVQLTNNLPQIIIRNKNQVKVQSPITAAEAAYFIGDTVTVVGKVSSSKSFKENENLPTLLNLGASYPNHLLTIAIKSKSNKLFDEFSENYYTNKEIKVTGKVVLYRNKPQIEVFEKNQIQIFQDDATLTAGIQNQLPNNNQKTEIIPAVLRDSSIPLKSTSSNETANAPLGLETMAQYPGGESELIKFLNNNLQCPDIAETGEKRSVILSFSVGLKGEISNIQIVKSAGRLYDNEAIRVIKTMPKWIPRKQNGEAVIEKLNQTITFQCAQ